MLSLRNVALAATLLTGTSALSGITVPSTVAGGQPFQITFQNPGNDQYRVFLAAAVTTTRGASCYLQNSTTLHSPLNLTVPSDVGPSAGYYSIAIRDLTTGESLEYSPTFNLTGGTGNATQYEQSLGGAPFWDANSLPCSAIQCARQCAQAGYPDDLTQTAAFDTMKTCITSCPGVSADDAQTSPVQASDNVGGSVSTKTASEVVVTLAPGNVVTAEETTVTSGGKTYTEALIEGSSSTRTLTLGGQTTLASHTLSLASQGLDVDGTTTMAFSNVIETETATVSSGSVASPSSSGLAAKQTGFAGAVVVAGLAAALL